MRVSTGAVTNEANFSTGTTSLISQDGVGHVDAVLRAGLSEVTELGAGGGRWCSHRILFVSQEW